MNNKKFLFIIIGVFVLCGVISAGLLVSSSKAALSQKMFIPAYFYPGSLWEQAISRTPTVDVMVMNPNSGPGSNSNSDYVNAVSSAQSAGIKVIGYVHTSYSNRDMAIVKSEIDAYKEWYAVDGIFLDEVSSSADLISYYQELADYIKNSDGTLVALNPGTIPAEEYMNVGDIVNIFEGTYQTYANWEAPSWASEYSPSKFSHLIYNVANFRDMKKAIRWSGNRFAGYVYATNDVLPNPWDTLPSYMSAELKEINKNSF
ncbi:MAG: spherulation-specific family 4 protein [Patescibacteria group bacterium]|nr:spherulation-specific family 4 protein [Patescibacteria group bacterium]